MIWDVEILWWNCVNITWVDTLALKRTVSIKITNSLKTLQTLCRGTKIRNLITCNDNEVTLT